MVINGAVDARTVLVNRARHQFFTGTALPGNQHSAGLRRHGLNHVKNGAHLGALPDDVVEPGQPADFPPQVARFLLPLHVLSDFANRYAQLLHQVVVLDYVAVGAFIGRRNRCFQRRHAGNQHEVGIRRDFLA